MSVAADTLEQAWGVGSYTRSLTAPQASHRRDHQMTQTIKWLTKLSGLSVHQTFMSNSRCDSVHLCRDARTSAWNQILHRLVHRGVQ